MKMEDSRIFFSIIIPVYNVEVYIEECLNSVLNQTFKDFELIIVNDGSSDKSMLVAEPIIEKDERVCVIHQSNAGICSARNAGIKRARGEYLYFMDSDDWIDPDMLKELHQVIRKERLPDVVAFNAKTFADVEGAEEKIQTYERYYSRPYLKTGLLSAREYYSEMHAKKNVVVSPCLYVTKATFFRDRKLRFYSGIIHEDELFTRQLLMEAERVFYCSKKYYFRRLRPGSITQAGISNHKITSFIKIADQLLILYKEKGIPLLRQDAYKFYHQALRFMDTVSGEKPKPQTAFARWIRKALDAWRLILVRNTWLRKIAFRHLYTP